MVETGDFEGRLCGELAASIARRATMHGRKGEHFHYNFRGDDLAAKSALKGLGLLASVPEEIEADIAALTMDADDMPDFLAQHVGSHDPRFPELLQAYLRIVCDTEDNPMPARRGPFDCPEVNLNDARVLAAAGYLELADGRYRWTDKIGPAMVAVYFWNADFESLAKIEERELEAESDEIVRTMPDKIVEIFKEHTESILGMQFLLCRLWRNGAWLDAPENDDDGSLYGGNFLARRVLEKFRAKHGIAENHGT